MADMRHYDGVDSFLYSLIHHASANVNQYPSQRQTSQVGSLQNFQRDDVLPHANDNYLSFSTPPNRSNQIQQNIPPLFPQNRYPYNPNEPNYGNSLIVNNTRNYYDDHRSQPPRNNRFYNAGNPPPSYNSRYKWGAQNRPAHPDFNVPYNTQPIIQQFNQPVYHTLIERNSRSRLRDDPYARLPHRPVMPERSGGNRGISRDSTTYRGNSRDSTKNRGNSREPTRNRGNSRNKRKMAKPKNPSSIQIKGKTNDKIPDQTNSKNQTSKSTINETNKNPEKETVSNTKNTQDVAIKDTESGNTILNTVVTENNIDSFFTIDKGPTEDSNNQTAVQKELLPEITNSCTADLQTTRSVVDVLPQIEPSAAATVNINTPQNQKKAAKNKQKNKSSEKKKNRQKKSKPNSPKVMQPMQPKSPQVMQRCRTFFNDISTKNVLNASTASNDTDVELIPVVIPHINLDTDSGSESDVVEIPKTPAPLVVISDSEAEGVLSEAENVASPKPAETPEKDETIFATPNSKQKKRKKKKKSIDPPSRISTPDSNDFMGNDLENLDLNVEQTVLERETVVEQPYNPYETEESSCCSDWCGPITQTPNPTENNSNQTNENRYQELDLVTFENLITPNRDDKTNKGDQSNTNVSENVTTVSFSGNNSHKIIATTSNHKNTSDSSSESSDTDNHSKELDKTLKASTPQKSKQIQISNLDQEISQSEVTKKSNKSHTDSQVYAWNLLDDPLLAKDLETSLVTETEKELSSPHKSNKKRKKRRSERGEGEISFTASETSNQGEIPDTELGTSQPESAKKSNKTHTDSQLFAWNILDQPTTSKELDTSLVTEKAVRDKTTKKRKKCHSEKEESEITLNESKIGADQSECPDTDINISRNTTLNEADTSNMTVVATKRSKKKKKKCKEFVIEDETVIENKTVELTTVTKKKNRKRNSSGKVLNESAKIPEENGPDLTSEEPMREENLLSISQKPVNKNITSIADPQQFEDVSELNASTPKRSKKNTKKGKINNSLNLPPDCSLIETVNLSDNEETVDLSSNCESEDIILNTSEPTSPNKKTSEPTTLSTCDEFLCKFYSNTFPIPDDVTNSERRAYNLNMRFNAYWNMDKDIFYNSSWNGEMYDHEKEQRIMPKTRDAWRLLIEDKYPKNGISPRAKKRCDCCNNIGHHKKECPFKACFMCGSKSHQQYNCSDSCCLTCFLQERRGFTNSCHKCSSWKNSQCLLCGIYGHKNNVCPDLWRRYHLTVKESDINNLGNKNKSPLRTVKLWCSVCASRGHLAEKCYVQTNLLFPPNQMKIVSYINMYSLENITQKFKINDNHWNIYNTSFDRNSECFYQHQSFAVYQQLLNCKNLCNVNLDPKSESDNGPLEDMDSSMTEQILNCKSLAEVENQSETTGEDVDTSADSLTESNLNNNLESNSTEQLFDFKKLAKVQNKTTIIEINLGEDSESDTSGQLSMSTKPNDEQLGHLITPAEVKGLQNPNAELGISVMNDDGEDTIVNITSGSILNQLQKDHSINFTTKTIRPGPVEKETPNLDTSILKEEALLNDLDQFETTLLLLEKDIATFENFETTDLFKEWVFNDIKCSLTLSETASAFSVSGPIKYRVKVQNDLENFLQKGETILSSIKQDLKLIFDKWEGKPPMRLFKNYTYLDQTNDHSDLKIENLKRLNALLFGIFNSGGICTEEIKVLRNFYDAENPELTNEVKRAYDKVFLTFHGNYVTIIEEMGGKVDSSKIADKLELYSVKQRRIVVKDYLKKLLEFSAKAVYTNKLKKWQKKLDRKDSEISNSFVEKIRSMAKEMRYPTDIKLSKYKVTKGIAS